MLVGLALVVLTATSGLAAPSRERSPARVAAPTADGLRVEARTTYVLDPPNRVVRVAIELSLTNELASRRRDGYLESYYFDSFLLAVPVEAAAIRATRDGRALTVSTRATELPQYQHAEVALSPHLQSSQRQQLRIEFELPAMPPRTDTTTRINDASSSFPVVAVGDPGLASVEVLVPAGLDAVFVGDELVAESGALGTVHRAEAIEDPDGFWSVVSIRDDEALVRRPVEVSGVTVDVESWPDDPAWVDFVAGQLTEGIPVMEDLLEREWPASTGLAVVETVSPHLYGFAGWYDPVTATIEMGEELEPRTILHELAHLWFNGEKLAGRWLGEGLAEEYATAVLERRDATELAPPPLDPDSPEAFPLNEWEDPTFDVDEPSDDLYGYAASWTVLSQLADEVGYERLADAVGAALDLRMAYRADHRPESHLARTDWRRFLDLLEEVAGSTTAVDVFRRWVTTPDEWALLDQRAVARTEYAELVDRSGSWAPPLAVREVMSLWRFDELRPLIERADGLLERRDEIEDVLETAGFALPPSLESVYERSNDFATLDREFDAHEHAAERLVRADEKVDAADGPLDRIGLLFGDAAGDRDAALDALEEGRTDDAVRLADDAAAAAGGATMQGLIRLLAVALLAAAVATLVIRRRRHRELVATPGPPPAAPGRGSVLEVLDRPAAPAISERRPPAPPPAAGGPASPRQPVPTTSRRLLDTTWARPPSRDDHPEQDRSARP